MPEIRVALVGDHQPRVTAHQAIARSLESMAHSGRPDLTWDWIGTETLHDASRQLAGYSAVWCVPASPYANTEGALGAIRFARETGRPFLGTCGGFQHAVLEFARNVMGLTQADHAESNPDGELLVITPLACSLVEQADTITLEEGSRAAAICAANEIEGIYRCSYGLSAQFESRLQGAALRVTGRDAAGDARVIELDNHPFFIATLFQPERAVLTTEVHPLVRALVAAASQPQRTLRAG